jgi:hypothetical protein
MNAPTTSPNRGWVVSLCCLDITQTDQRIDHVLVYLGPDRQPSESPTSTKPMHALGRLV